MRHFQDSYWEDNSFGKITEWLRQKYPIQNITVTANMTWSHSNADRKQTDNIIKKRKDQARLCANICFRKFVKFWKPNLELFFYLILKSEKQTSTTVF